MIPSLRMPGHLIRRIHQLSTRLFLQHVHEAGSDLTPVQFAALNALKNAPGIDQARLAEAIAQDRATTGAVIERLEQKRLVARVKNSKDRRARILRLTPAGQRTLSALLPVVESVQNEILSGLTEAERKQFVELATKVIANAAVDVKALDDERCEISRRTTRAAMK